MPHPISTTLGGYPWSTHPPREADLGLSLYHRLFRFVTTQKPAGGEPPFQYIITTTTELPEELRESPCLVARLGGADARERLLRRDL